MFDNPGRSQRLSERPEAGLNQLIEERDHLAYWLDLVRDRCSRSRFKSRVLAFSLQRDNKIHRQADYLETFTGFVI